jgi:hypothetical protein
MVFEDVENSIWLFICLFALSAMVFLVCCLIISGIFYLGGFKSRSLGIMITRVLIVGLPLGFTGVVSGFLTGLSRSPAVSATVPAALTFLGLVVVYLVGKGPARAIVAGFAVFVFSANLIVGTVLGGASRDRYAEQASSVDIRQFKANEEFKVRLYCKGLGLISDLTKPCPDGIEKKINETGENSADP